MLQSLFIPTQKAFFDSCCHGNIRKCQWLLSVNSTIDISVEDEGEFQWTCMNGHIEIDIEIAQYAFQLACGNGHIEIAQWLLSVKPTIDISIEGESTFQFTCMNGHIEIAQWLLSVKPTIDISAKDETAFQLACKKGHLKVAQWLLSIKPTINISVKGENAFQLACRDGHIEIAQWLLSVKPTIDISADGDFAFRFSCKNGHLEVAKWLVKVNRASSYKLILSEDLSKINSWSIKNTYNYQPLLNYSLTIPECPICYDQPCTLRSNCGHMFCQPCIDTNIIYNQSCPYCRNPQVVFTTFV